MKLFKRAQNALEQGIKSHEHDEAVLNQSRFWMRSITWGLVGTTAFGVAWLSLAKTEEIVVAGGTLQPIGAVKEIQMPVGGVAKEILVKDGDRVEAGQILIKLDTEISSQKRLSLEESFILKKNELSLKNIELQRFIEQNSGSIDTLSKRLDLEKEILERLESLAKQGATAELQYLKQRNTVTETEGQLRETTLQGLRQQSLIKQQMQKLKSEISELNANMTENRVTLRYQELRSPVEGLVFDLKPTGTGYTANTTETVMKIVPFNALEAKVEIPSEDIGFVRVGMPVDISIDSFPATDFGVINGTVQRVGSDALPPDASQQKNQYRFPTVIKLDSQQLELKNGKLLPLQVGMSLTANVKLRKVSYLQMLLGSFRDKADSLRQI